MTKETENKPEITVSVTEKKCGKCLVVLPASAFWKMRSSKDGLQPQCKKCQLGIEPVKVAPPLPLYQTLEKNAPEKAASKKSSASKKKNPIGSGRRKECSTCTYQIKSTEGGRCISEAAEKDAGNKSSICPYLEMTKTAKKKAKKAKKNAIL